MVLLKWTNLENEMSAMISAMCAKCLRSRLLAELGITIMFWTKCQLSGLANNEIVKMLSLLNHIQMKL